MATSESLEIKGIRDGLLVHMDATRDWKEQVKQLVARIDQQAAFFKGARLALDVGPRSVRRHELGTLQRMLTERNVVLWAILSESMTTMSTARKLGLQTNLEPAERRARPVEPDDETIPSGEHMLRVDPEDDTPPIDPEEVGTTGVMVKRTLRSGRTVRSEGHVVVLGDVNPGAEIVAGGDVIVWGRLRGVVHAGAHGDESAMVCALDMMPMQLRIAGHIATSPPEKHHDARPEIARVRDNQIVVELWNN